MDELYTGIQDFPEHIKDISRRDVLCSVIGRVKEQAGIPDGIGIGVAVMSYYGCTVHFILVVPRYPNDFGDRNVSGWMFFVEVHERELISDNSVKIVKSHNIAIRTLINEFYLPYVRQDGDLQKVKNHIVMCWNRTVRKKAVISNKCNEYIIVNDLNDAIGIEGVEDDIITAHQYINNEESLGRYKELIDLSDLKFWLICRDVVHKKTIIAFQVKPNNAFSVIMVSVGNDIPSLHSLLLEQNIESVRAMFWWVTSLDEEYQILEQCVDREYAEA